MSSSIAQACLLKAVSVVSRDGSAPFQSWSGADSGCSADIWPSTSHCARPRGLSESVYVRKSSRCYVPMSRLLAASAVLWTAVWNFVLSEWWATLVTPSTATWAHQFVCLDESPLYPDLVNLDSSCARLVVTESSARRRWSRRQNSVRNWSLRLVLALRQFVADI